VTTVAGHKNVLTDAHGGTLYVSDQERSGTVLCATNACTAIWAPLDVANGQHPTGPSSVSSHLGTVVRPDGKTQVTLDGEPLYTFTLDGGAGHTSGDGQHDSFGGTAFSWHTATTTGAATTSPSSTGGYGY
jgi:predicted lipoprotein with Yx(FWY)xxD motif